MHSIPRRTSDLDSGDIDCLIELCHKRLKTIRTSVQRTHISSSPELADKEQMMSNLVTKLERLRERTITAACDGA